MNTFLIVVYRKYFSYFRFRIVVRGLEKFLNSVVWHRTRSNDFSSRWCFALNLIHVLKQEQKLYEEPIVKAKKLAELNIKASGLDCLFENGKLDRRKFSEVFIE